MSDQRIFNGEGPVKVLSMDGGDIANQLQSVIDDENIMTVILTGKGKIKSTVTFRRKCAVYGMNAELLIEDDLEAFLFETGGIKIKGIDFYAVSGSNEQPLHKQCAIQMERTLDNSITECLFDGFGYCAVAHSKAVEHHQGNRILQCVFRNNAIGFAAFERGEYNQLTQCTFYHNKTAVLIQGGNNNLSGCIISNNDIGIVIGEGDNHGHGVISGCSINHNGKPFVVQNIKYGFIINGCPIYCGEILLENARYVKFSHCDISHIVLRVKSSDHNFITGCHLICFETDIDREGSVTFENNIQGI